MASADSAPEQFRKKLLSCTVETECFSCTKDGRKSCGRHFIRTEEFKKWLKSQYPQDSTRTCIGVLLETAYRQQNIPLARQGTREEDLDDGEHYLLVFSILFDLKLGHWIDTFRKHEFFDNALPISLLSLKDSLYEEDNLRAEAENVAAKFNGRQWAFCAKSFELRRPRSYQKDQIVPICQRDVITDKGGTAVMWQVGVPEEFVGPHLRSHFKEISERAVYQHKLHGTCYMFALKSFRAGNKHLFRNEVDAFTALENHDGMVAYLMDFEHADDESCRAKSPKTMLVVPNDPETTFSTTATHNILLECGEFDLEDMFRQKEPPVFETDVHAFWQQLYGVAKAVQRLHHFEHVRGKLRERYNAMHADIKPENILMVHGKLKLCDPGFCRVIQEGHKGSSVAA